MAGKRRKSIDYRPLVLAEAFTDIDDDYLLIAITAERECNTCSRWSRADYK